MTRLTSLTLLCAIVAACMLCACGGGSDDPPCDHPFTGPLAGPDQSAPAHCQ